MCLMKVIASFNLIRYEQNIVLLLQHKKKEKYFMDINNM